MQLPNRFKKKLITLLIFLVLTFITTEIYPRLQQKPSTDVLPSNTVITIIPIQVLKQEAQIIKVSDGDTIEVLLNGQKEKIRLIGVDTPEVVDPRKAVQCFGKEASLKTQELLNGKNVLLENDLTQANRDKYNRLLRYVYLLDNTLINKVLIEEGYGFEYTYDDAYIHQQAFKEAQRVAEIEKKGLWSDSTCSGSRITR